MKQRRQMRRQNTCKALKKGIVIGVLSAGALYVSAKCDIILDEEQQTWPAPLVIAT